jgi:biopolymer transport protein ExbD
MNLMVVLIPMLLVSAEFAKVAVIDIKLPKGGAQTETASTEQPPDDSNKLRLTAIVTDSVVTLGAKGGFMPSLFYREFHRYITRDDQLDTLLEYTPGQQPRHPKSGRELTIHERHDIYLYTVTSYEDREIIQSLYTKFGEMLTNADGAPVKAVNPGDTVFALTNPRRRIIVTDVNEFVMKPLSAYDELRNRLMGVKDRYREAEDGEDIIIAAENEVIYDKIVQIMDAARNAEFPNISIAKLRA